MSVTGCLKMDAVCLIGGTRELSVLMAREGLPVLVAEAVAGAAAVLLLEGFTVVPCPL